MFQLLLLEICFLPLLTSISLSMLHNDVNSFGGILHFENSRKSDSCIHQKPNT